VSVERVHPTRRRTRRRKWAAPRTVWCLAWCPCITSPRRPRLQVRHCHHRITLC